MMQVEEEIYHEVGRLQVQEVGRLQVQEFGVMNHQLQALMQQMAQQMQPMAPLSNNPGSYAQPLWTPHNSWQLMESQTPHTQRAFQDPRGFQDQRGFHDPWSAYIPRSAIDWNKPPRCGGEFIHGEPNAGCCENEETGAWTCHCREGGPAKKNYELIFLLFKMVYSAKLHLSKDFKSEWTIFCNKHLAVDCPTFSRFLPIDYAQLRKKFIEILKAIIVANGDNPGGRNSLKHETPLAHLCIKINHERALDAEAEAEEVDEEEDEEGVARPVIERTIDEEAGTETIRTANKPQNGAMVLGLDPNAPQPLRVAAAKRPPRPADPVLA
ncbi:hypothetical protein B484DRAFT_394997, partial [Ochromonadaceae sp. CCMP2298]